MNTFSIKDIESITGIKAATLRVWEQRYDLLPSKRTETNIRFYDDNDLRFLLNVSLLIDSGLKISKIALMSEQERADVVINLKTCSENVAAKINALCDFTLSLNELGFKKILAQSFKKHGVEQTVLTLIYPFLHKVGILWQTGMINPAQEHFSTNLIKQQLIVAIDQIKVPFRLDKKKFLLFLPDGEFHEIGLLFSHFVLRSQGFEVLYLGQNLPVPYVFEIYNSYNPDFILTVLTNSISSADLDIRINDLSKFFSKTPVLVAGATVNAHQLSSFQNINPLYEINDLLGFIKNIAA